MTRSCGVLKRVADPETADASSPSARASRRPRSDRPPATLFALGIPGTEQRLADARGARQGRDRRRSCAGSSSTRRCRAPSRRSCGTWPPAAVSRTASPSWHASPRCRSTRRRCPAGTASPATPRRRSARRRWRSSPSTTPRARSTSSWSSSHSSTTRPSRCSSGRSPGPPRGRGRPSPTASCPSWPRASRARARSSSRSCSGCPDRRDVVRRYIVFSKTLAGWARDRALESMRAFEGDLIEPTIELLSDPDQEVRASAMLVAQSFEDPRIVPATIGLLKDPDWWIRITAAETLGRLKDPRGVAAPRRGALRPRDALERGRGARADRRPAGGARSLGAAPGPRPRGADRGHPGPPPLRAPADARLRAQRGEAGPLARRARPGPRDRPARWRRTSRRSSPTRTRSSRRRWPRSRAPASRSSTPSWWPPATTGPPTSTSRSASPRSSDSPPTSSAPRASPSPRSRPRP